MTYIVGPPLAGGLPGGGGLRRGVACGLPGGGGLRRGVACGLQRGVVACRGWWPAGMVARGGVWSGGSGAVLQEKYVVWRMTSCLIRWYA
jgi:hypothetical protein